MLTLLRKLRASTVVAVALMASVVFLVGCTHRKVMQLGTHKVTVARHGFEKRLRVSEQGSVPTLEYAGMSTEGKGLKVSIKGDAVRVNDVDYGRLRPGDSVFIGDEGLAVNQLDYGESEKYLRANTAEPAITSLN